MNPQNDHQQVNQQNSELFVARRVASTKVVEQAINRARFNEANLLPVIVQQWNTLEVLMLAWMNPEALRRTLSEGRVTYWSRSRAEFWLKGNTSGNVQLLHSVAFDCDADTLLLRVEQSGSACHTGTHTCFDGDELALTSFNPDLES